MKPHAWVIHWDQHPDGTPAGSRTFHQRAAARGFLMMRKASGFNAWIETIGG